MLNSYAPTYSGARMAAVSFHNTGPKAHSNSQRESPSHYQEPKSFLILVYVLKEQLDNYSRLFAWYECIDADTTKVIEHLAHLASKIREVHINTPDSAAKRG